MVAATNPVTPITMSVTARRSELKKAVSVLNRVSDRKSHMPILGAMFVKADDSTTKLVATDLNMWATYTTTPLGRTRGDACVRTKSLWDVLSKMPEGEITIARGDSFAHVHVMQGSVSVHVDAFAPRDYPKVPDTSALQWTTIEASDLATCLERVISCVCKDETRFHLNGIYLEGSSARLKAVATDGHRLAFASSSYDDAYKVIGTKGIILPAKAAKEILKVIKSGKAEIALDDRRMFHIRQGAWEFSVKPIDAQFPPYEQVVPKANKHAVAVDLESFRGACERAKVGYVSGRGMMLKRGDNDPMLKLDTGADSDTRVTESIPCSLGDDFKVGINPQYLLDALEHMESRTSRVEILIGAELDPILIYSHDETPGSPFVMRHFVVVMPMRL